MKIDVTPKTAAANQDTPLQVTGTSFKAADFNVTVNGQSVTPTEVTDQSFKLVVQAAQVKSPKITIRVTANQASDSADIAVT
jgi:IPT/TIG domain